MYLIVGQSICNRLELRLERQIVVLVVITAAGVVEFLAIMLIVAIQKVAFKAHQTVGNICID